MDAMTTPTPSSIAEAREIPLWGSDETGFTTIDGPYRAYVCMGNNPGYEVFVKKPDGSNETFIHCGKTLDERMEAGALLAHRLSRAHRAALALDRRDEKASREMVRLAQLGKYAVTSWGHRDSCQCDDCQLIRGTLAQSRGEVGG